MQKTVKAPPEPVPGGGVRCKIGGRVTTVDTVETCTAMGGTVVTNGTTPPTKFCCVRGVLITSLSRTIFDLGTKFPVEMEFREQLLAKTQVGKKILKLYFANADELLGVTDSDV